MFTFEYKSVFDFIEEKDFDYYFSKGKDVMKSLSDKTCEGNDFLGWIDTPKQMKREIIEKINETAFSLNKGTDVIVVIGIGGSYLGARAVIESLNQETIFKRPKIVYAGHNIGEDYLSILIKYLDEVDYSIIVISKSGTTTEPAIAFRILKKHLEKKYGKAKASVRIAAVTDLQKGALRKLTDEEGYKSFVIPDDVGGRFSVLTPVGLLPIAAAGINIEEIIKGAAEMRENVLKFHDDNLSLQYASVRNALYKNGKCTEIMVNYHDYMNYFSEWWKQLFGESEGKDGKGIFPASVSFTTDLHSMGQYIQDGVRNIFETVLWIEKPKAELLIPQAENDLDELNYLSGKSLNFVNKMAMLGTQQAHTDGGVPSIRISCNKITGESIGQLIFFFEYACAISGLMLGVNPFNQPGVEAYKGNMFRLLKKPGY